MSDLRKKCRIALGRYLGVKPSLLVNEVAIVFEIIKSEGLVIVPREPTEKMIHSACSAVHERSDNKPWNNKAIVETAYKAMIDAAEGK